MSWFDSFLMAYRQPDGTCQPFKAKDKKINVVVNNSSPNNTETTKLFEIVSDLTKENRELSKKNSDLQIELINTKNELNIAKAKLQNVEYLMDIAKDDINEGFSKTMKIILGTTES